MKTGSQDVDLLHRLQEVESPELAAVPDAALSQHHDRRDDDIAEILTLERLAPGIDRGLPFGLDRLEDRRLLEAKPDIDRDRDEKERKDERQSPAPFIERFGAEDLPGAHDYGQGENDAERGRGLEPPGVIAAFFIAHVLGDISDRTPVLPTQAESLDHPQHEEDDRGQETDRGVGRDGPDERG